MILTFHLNIIIGSRYQTTLPLQTGYLLTSQQHRYTAMLEL